MRRIQFSGNRGRSYAYNALVKMLTPGGRGDEFDSETLPPYRGSQGDEISEPASRLLSGGESSSPGRSFLGRTEDDLNTGQAPNRIERLTTMGNAGIIGAGIGSPSGIAGWPYDGNALYIPHQRIPRVPITVTPFSRTIDTSVTVPSIGIGSPV